MLLILQRESTRTVCMKIGEKYAYVFTPCISYVYLASYHRILCETRTRILSSSWIRQTVFEKADVLLIQSTRVCIKIIGFNVFISTYHMHAVMNWLVTHVCLVIDKNGRLISSQIFSKQIQAKKVAWTTTTNLVKSLST